MLASSVCRSGIHVAALLALVALTGCHADMTYRIDVRPDGSALVTMKDVMDEQFYNIATSQNSSTFDAPAGQGWTQTKSIDADDNHVIVLTRTVTKDDVSNLGLPGNLGGSDAATAASSSPKLLSSLHTEPGLFTDRTSFDTQVPALMPKTDESNPYASAGANIAASLVSIHFVVSAPGKVLDTNGETLPDGATRWTLSLTSPTTLHYVVETPNLPHIIIAIVLAIAAMILVVILMRRRSAQAKPSY